MPPALPLKPNQPNLLFQLLLHDNHHPFSHAPSLSPKRSTCCGMIAHRMSWFAAEHQRVCAGVKFFKDPKSPSGVLLQVSPATHKTAFVFIFFGLLAPFLTLVAPPPAPSPSACCFSG